MAHEIETKVLDIDAGSIIAQLESLGAKKTQEIRLSVDWFRPKGVKEGEDEWYLRIRSYSDGRHEVTWKAKSEIVGKVRKHKEINFLTQNPGELGNLFEEIGLERYAHQDKDRTSYSLDDLSFDIDQYPGMPAFLEIEGPTEDAVHNAIERLGLGANRTWAKGERTLIQQVYNLDWYQMRF